MKIKRFLLFACDVSKNPPIPSLVSSGFFGDPLIFDMHHNPGFFQRFASFLHQNPPMPESKSPFFSANIISHAKMKIQRFFGDLFSHPKSTSKSTYTCIQIKRILVICSWHAMQATKSINVCIKNSHLVTRIGLSGFAHLGQRKTRYKNFMQASVDFNEAKRGESK